MGSEVDVYIHKGYSSRDVMRPFITLEGEAMDALEFYKSIFPNFSIDSIKYHQEPYENLIMLAKFVIDEQEVLISDSYVNHDWGITPGISFFINANSEKELRNLETKLSENGKVSCQPVIMAFQNIFPGLKIDSVLIGNLILIDFLNH